MFKLALILPFSHYWGISMIEHTWKRENMGRKESNNDLDNKCSLLF